jgi:putative transposase
VANTLTLSTGEHWRMPAGLAKIERRKRRAQRVLARRKRGSSRQAKARRRVAALQARAARIRQDWRHKASLAIPRRVATVVLEDLATQHDAQRQANRGGARNQRLPEGGPEPGDPRTRLARL